MFFTERSTADWFDYSFENLLFFIDRMQGILMGYTRTVAMICFVMSVGITCIKLAMSGSGLNKELTKLLMAVITYFVMIWAFPGIMETAFGIISDVSHSITVGADFKAGEYELSNGTKEGFYDWVYKAALGKPRTETAFADTSDPDSPYYDPSGMNIVTYTKVLGYGEDHRAQVDAMLELRITDDKTKLISLNQVMRFGFITVKLIWNTLQVNNIVDFAKQFVDIILCLLAGIFYIACFIMAIIQYITTVVEYHVLMAMGILFIPLLLWEGTKHAYESLIRSIFTISIKLLVVQIITYLCMVISVDIIKIMYNEFIANEGSAGYDLKSVASYHIEFYLNIFVMSLFMKLLADNGPEFASFLSGGQPRLSFGEFAQAAMAAGAAAGAGAAMIGAGAKAAGNVALGGAGALAAGGTAMAGAAGAEKSAGANKVQQMKAGAQALVSSLGRSALGGISSAVDSGISRVTSLPSTARQAGNTFGYMVSPASPLSAEGVGRGLSNGIGSKGGGRGGGGGGMGGAGSLLSGNHAQDQEKLQQLKNSKNANERLEGAKMQYQMNRMYGGPNGENYSGLRGRFKSMSNSIDGYVQGSSENAPGSFRQSPQLRKKMADAEKESKV